MAPNAPADFVAQYEQGGYLDKVPEWHAGDAPWKGGKVLQMLQKHRLEPATLCDVGCGSGDVLAWLQARLGGGTRCVGYDISPQAIALCKPKENQTLEFRRCDFLTESDERYEVLTLLDVFEHVPDYLGFLAALQSRADWFVFHIPLDINVQTVFRKSASMIEMRERYGHLHYFTAETALATLSDTGYAVVDAFYTWDTEIGGRPKPAPGLMGKLRYPLTCLIYAFEKPLFFRRPGLAARLRRRYNLLVLAKPR